MMPIPLYSTSGSDLRSDLNPASDTHADQCAGCGSSAPYGKKNVVTGMEGGCLSAEISRLLRCDAIAHARAISRMATARFANSLQL